MGGEEGTQWGKQLIVRMRSHEAGAQSLSTQAGGLLMQGIAKQRGGVGRRAGNARGDGLGYRQQAERGREQAGAAMYMALDGHLMDALSAECLVDSLLE